MDGANLHADLEGHWAIELALVEALGSGGCGSAKLGTVVTQAVQGTAAVRVRR